jgi:branched-chain amino acid transport system substrate-binding protein
MAVEGYGPAKVVIETRDDAGDSVTAVTSVRELLTTTGASVVVGPLLTEAALQVADLMRAERRPLLTFAKSGYFAPGDGLYRLGPTAESQVDSLVDYIGTQFTFTRYGLVYPADAAGEEFAELFRARVQDLGLPLVHESTYQKADFSALFAIAQEAREKNLDAVFMPDSLSSAARFFSYLNVGGGRVVRPLGTASWDNTAELQQSRAIMEGAIFVSPFFRASSEPDIAKFVASYRSRYGTEPDFLAAQGFDAGALVMEALRRAGALGVSFDEGLSRIGALEGLTGTIEIRPDGALRRQFRVVAFEQGRVREAAQESVLTSDGISPEVTQLAPEEERIIAAHEQSLPPEGRR